MERFYKYICFCVFFFLFSCQNEGYIGPLYGQWALKKCCVNGEIKEPDNIYFSFQGKVVWVKSVNVSYHIYNDVFGSYKHVGDSLFFEFVQKSEYTLPKQLIEETCGFSDATNVRVYISSFSSSDLILSKGIDYWIFEKF